MVGNPQVYEATPRCPTVSRPQGKGDNAFANEGEIRWTRGDNTIVHDCGGFAKSLLDLRNRTRWTWRMVAERM